MARISGPGVEPEEPSEPASPALEADDAQLAARLPESLTVHVELPEPVHAPAEDEAAVAIEEVAITPVAGPVAGAATTTIVLDPEQHASLPDGLEAPVMRTDGPSPESADELAGVAAPARSSGSRPAPEGLWTSLVYRATLHQVNLGDAPAVRERKELEARIGRRLEGGARFVPVLARKGGVGKTTITALLGMALADVREDRVVAIDANPDRGTLAERIPQQTRSTVRDLVVHAPSIRGFEELSAHVSRDATRLDVLASDTDPLVSEAFDEDGYNVVADIVARYYSIVLADCGTGVVHSAVRAALGRADQLVVVSGGSLDEARLASETLTWLEANGYGELVSRTVVALNTATQGTSLDRLDEIEAHFRSRVREVVRIPYDPELASGSVVRYEALKQFTRDSARELAALVVDGLARGEAG